MKENKGGIRISVILIVLALAAVAAILVIAGIYAARRDEAEYGDLDIEDASDTHIELFGGKYVIEDDYRSYLIIGTDEKDTEDGDAEFTAGMADFLLLLAMNRTQGTYSLLHINRDTMAQVDYYNGNGDIFDSKVIQIAGAHAFGVTEAQCNEHTVAAVRRFLGDIPINGYYAVKMSDIGAVNSLVGGVEVKASGDKFIEQYGWKEGETVTLTDEQAYEFVHTRYGVGDQTNMERMERQRMFMEGFLDKLTSMSAKDIAFVDKTYMELNKIATSDLPGNEVYKIINRICTGEGSGIVTYDGEMKIADTYGDGVDHMEFYADEDSLLEAMREVYNVNRVLDASNYDTEEDFDVIEFSMDDDDTMFELFEEDDDEDYDDEDDEEDDEDDGDDPE